MRSVFADTYYFLAIYNELDAHHGKTVKLARELRSVMVTTDWVLTEFADALAASIIRSSVPEFIRDLMKDPGVTVVAEEDLFERGLNLYESRPDKHWSLTDCISFVVMKDRGITEALTGDKHFEQAGFLALLK